VEQRSMAYQQSFFYQMVVSARCGPCLMSGWLLSFTLFTPTLYQLRIWRKFARLKVNGGLDADYLLMLKSETIG